MLLYNFKSTDKIELAIRTIVIKDYKYERY